MDDLERLDYLLFLRDVKKGFYRRSPSAINLFDIKNIIKEIAFVRYKINNQKTRFY